MKKDQDFKDFLQGETKSPDKLDYLIMSKIEAELNPSKQKVFIKLCTIQAFIGLLTMLFCPQFNLSLTNNYDLFHFFHTNFGHAICMILCGSIFLGTGAIFASYILSKTELKIIKNSSFLYYSALSILAITCFLILGAEVYLDLVLYWMTGATLTGFLLFEFNTTLRQGPFEKLRIS